MGDPATDGLMAPAGGAQASQPGEQDPQPAAADTGSADGDTGSPDTGSPDTGSGSPDDGSGSLSTGTGSPDDGTGSGSDGQQAAAGQLDVRYDVPLITQPDGMTCWAAALAMIQSYRDQASYSVDYFAGPSPHSWMTWSQIEPVAVKLGFTEIAPADMLPTGWRDLLAVHGPLWIVVKAAVSNAASHAVVLAGISGDGSQEGTQMTSNNPAGTVDVQPFTDFADRWDFGAVAGASIFAPQ